ncbi:hypothetical protein CAPTEDRAFT_130039, partial [Capitella teleta]
GVEYDGTHNITKSGRTCQRWDSQTPHAHNYETYKFPNSEIDHNYCRNPSNSTIGPWCLTTDTGTEFETCDVMFCASCDREYG